MSQLIVEDRDAVRWITFNRPAQLNTLRLDDLQAATAAVGEATAAGRTIVFTGAGERAFCAGMNLDVFAEIVDDPSLARRYIGAVRGLLDAVRTAEVVTVAAINGHCLGAAFELALACDFRVAVHGALLGLPEMKLGLPCILDSALLPQYVGLSLAKEMMLTGQLYPSERLDGLGAFTVVDGLDAMREEADRLTAGFAEVPPAGIASQKRLFEAWQNLSIDRFNDVSLEEIDRVFHDEATRQRVTTYTEQLRARA